MGDSRLNHLGSLLESKNSTIRKEAANALGKYCLSDNKVVEILLKYCCSPAWDSRVSAGDALQAILKNMDTFLNKSDLDEVSPELRDFDIHYILMTFKALLSVDSASLGSSDSGKLSSRQQRQLIDQHLDLQSATGLSSTRFLSDAEVLPANNSSSPKCDEREYLTIDCTIIKSELNIEENNGYSCNTSYSALIVFVCRLLPLLIDQRWQFRHGTAIALSRVLAGSYASLPPALVDNCALRLLQILVLDQFNDFVSGRSATAPVRETCAQALGHLLHKTNEARRIVILNHLRILIGMKGEKLWHCRQSALLVLKYFFAVASSSPLFDECFELVVSSLADPVDDVVSCAVSTLSSFLSNSSIDERRAQFVEQVMRNVWYLLEQEARKEQLRSGLDSLAIDLMSIVDTWLRVENTGFLNRQQHMMIVGMIDAMFQSRTQKIINLLSVSLRRGEQVLTGEDVFITLKIFFRVLLFAAPAADTVLLELVYLTSLSLLDKYKKEIMEGDWLARSFGLWTGCLLFDHRNPLIDVFTYGVDGPSSSHSDPFERMGSEEMRFLSDREKDNVYVTRKILAAKFLAALLQILYDSGVEMSGQPLSLAVQLLFVPYLRSDSLYQNLGASIILNEWAALFKAAINRGIQKEPPMTVISLCDGYLRAPAKTFDELTSSVTQLTQDCSEFVEYCAVRGVNKEKLNLGESSSAEDISRTAYEMCRAILEDEKHIESLNARYNLLVEWMEFTKLAVKANSIRVFALLSSTLFYFGFAPEKLTPMVRPLVECMQTEENETVAAEVYKGSIPLMVAYSWSRTPRPYVKVLNRALDIFASCSNRIPQPEDWSSPTQYKCILSLIRREQQIKPTPQSRNAELMLLVCSSFTVDQMPEYYAHFGLDDCPNQKILLCRLELHGCFWSRVGSRLSTLSSNMILNLLKSSNPALRYAGAKSIVTFARSQLGDTVTRTYHSLASMLSNIEVSNERRGAIEAMLGLSYLDVQLSGAVALFAPLVFARLTDKEEEIRDAAGEAFRNFVPLLALEDMNISIPGLSDELIRKRIEHADFVNVLSSPGCLPLIETKNIKGLCPGIQLRHYQLEGITWMRFLRKFSLNGILADDMGLGKTLQTLCTLSMAVDYDPKSIPKCSLIVCPRTLVDHWCNEWHRFFPGRPRARRVECSPVQWKAAELVVIAYEDLKNNIALSRITWNYVVLDEGHVLRNPKTAIWRAANELMATNRLILSGTPVQNSPADLWALFTWLMPGYLGDERQFRAQFLKKILKCRTHKATAKDIQDGSDAVSHLHRLILPFVMRRLKTEVLRELPEKNVQDCECQLSEQQRTIYKFIVDRCTANREMLRSNRGISPLHALITLRKLVDHPSLIEDVLYKLSAPDHIKAIARTASSGKMAALGQLLNECGIGLSKDDEDDMEDDALVSSAALEMPHRALIFCQWKSTVQLVSNALQCGDFGCPVAHLVLDGTILPSDRQHVVDRFNSDHSIDVLVLTTHIGGVGLNLTGADVVIFMDHDWNPMKDLQAIDRAHRLGQTRKVNVYRLITQGTIEDKVMSLHRFKQSTADALIGSENRSLQSMATDELMNMLTLDKDVVVNADSGPMSKRQKVKGNNGDAHGIEEQWNLAELWDESQYEQQFDVAQFMKDAS